MKEQVITIGQDGSMLGLDHKRKGVKMQEFGQAETQRVTLIEWDAVKQEWFIKWYGRKADKAWAVHEFASVGLDYRSLEGRTHGGTQAVVYFKEYEDAVEAEVVVIQSKQLDGETV